jgi:hypothetical protein
MTLVFMHIPKTAGTSFRSGLEARFRGEMACDYPHRYAATPFIFKEIQKGDGPLPARVERVAEGLKEMAPKVLCGHFPASRYLPYYPAENFITFLRARVARTFSNFNHLRVIGGIQMPLERYARGPGANLQSKLLEGADIDAFTLVGITELYPQSLELFESRTGIRLPNRRKNAAGSLIRRLRRKQAPIEFTPEVEAVIREHTKEDEALYERALAKFKEDYKKEVGRPLPSPQRPS